MNFAQYILLESRVENIFLGKDVGLNIFLNYRAKIKIELIRIKFKYYL